MFSYRNRLIEVSFDDLSSDFIIIFYSSRWRNKLKDRPDREVIFVGPCSPYHVFQTSLSGLWFFVLSDLVIAIGASMQNIFPIVHAVGNHPTAANKSNKWEKESTSNEVLIMAKTFFDCSKDFFITVRTSCPNRISSSLGY